MAYYPYHDRARAVAEAATDTDAYREAEANEGVPFWEMVNRDWESWRGSQQGWANQYGASWGEDDIQSLVNNLSYANNAGRNPAEFLAPWEEIYRQRGLPSGTGASGGSGGSGTGGNFDWQGDATFSDEPTRRYEELLRQQADLYAAQSQQQQEWLNPLIQQQRDLIGQQQQYYTEQMSQLEAARVAAEERRAAARTAGGDLEAYLRERVGRLQGPAYTDSEANILATRLLDPLERDRTASQQRALERVSQRGMDPTSGVAQELQRQINRQYDEERTRVNADIAYRQITEQRSREQEAQQLLGLLAQIPDAQARGDLEFLASANQLANDIRERQLQATPQGAGTVQDLLDLLNTPTSNQLLLGRELSDLPGRRLQEALGALTGGGAPASAMSGLLQLLQQQQNARQMNANWWSAFL